MEDFESDEFSSEDEWSLLDSGDVLSIPDSFSSKDNYSSSKPEIINTFSSLQGLFDPPVVRKAIEIYYELNHQINTKSIKGTRKACLVFYCFFVALDRLGETSDPCYVADLVNLPRNKIERAFAEFSPSGLNIYNPLSLVKFYIKRYNEALKSAALGFQIDQRCVEKGVVEIIERCRESRMGREWIENSSAKIVAIASIHFYLEEIKGMDMNTTNDLFVDACYLSLPCIKRYHDSVSKYYNMDKNLEDACLNNKIYNKIKTHF